MDPIPTIFTRHQPNPLSSPQEADHDIENYISFSCKLAKQILEPALFGYTPQERQMGRVTIKHYHIWGAPTPIMMMPQPVYVVGGRHARRDEKNPSDGLRMLAGIAGAVLGGYAIYKVGQTINHIRDAGQEINENTEFKTRLDNWGQRLFQIGDLNNPSLQSLQVISDKRDSIFSRIKHNAVLNLIIAISMVVAAVFLLAGAIAGVGALMGIGLTFALITGAGFLFKIGFMSSDKRDVEDATVIKHEIGVLTGSNRYYDSLYPSCL